MPRSPIFRPSSGLRRLIDAQRRQQGDQAAAAANAEGQRLAEEQAALKAAEAARGPGYIGLAANKYERLAGVTPPGFEGFRHRETGKLLEDFAFDPYKSEMTRRLREEALAEGPSRWAQSALQRQQFEEAQRLGSVGLEQQRAQSQALGQLMRQGGLGGGARASLARAGMRDALMAAQDVRAQGAQRRFGITDADLLRKQDITGALADVERQGQLQNIGMLEKDVLRRGEFDRARYLEQMKAWAAEQQAAAQRAAGGRGGCFPEWTTIKMRNGEWKKISEIEVGDELFLGGKVIGTHFFYSDEDQFPLYDYLGVDVTGGHAVLEYSEWTRVENSKRGIKTARSVGEVYNLSTESHLILVNGVLFADYMETDEDFADDQESLRALNGAVL